VRHGCRGLGGMVCNGNGNRVLSVNAGPQQDGERRSMASSQCGAVVAIFAARGRRVWGELAREALVGVSTEVLSTPNSQHTTSMVEQKDRCEDVSRKANLNGTGVWQGGRE
jgi:hypothetical protein